MDRINKDEAHPGESVVSAKFQLTDAIVSSVFTTNTGNFAWYVASYTEQILGTGNNQLKNAELRSINESGQTILMVTHSNVAASYANRVMFIKDGEVFHEIYRGESSDEQLYQKISDTLTMLATGGERHA